MFLFRSASHLVVPDLSVTVLCCVGSCVPLPCAPQPSFLFLVSSVLLASFVPCCLLGRGLAEDFGCHFAQGVVLRACPESPILTGGGSGVIPGGMHPVSSWGPSHPTQGLGLKAVSHCGPLTELG